MSNFVFRPLSELCLPITMTDPRRTPEREFWYVDISAVDNNAKRISTPRRVNGKSASIRARQVIQTNDVLVATTRPNLNAVALVPKQYNGEICSTGFCVLRAGEKLDPEYLFIFVCSQAFVTPLVELTKGALYPAVTEKQVMAQAIPCFPINEQRKIAARLKAQLAEVAVIQQAAAAQLSEIERLPQRILAQAFNAKRESP